GLGGGGETVGLGRKALLFSARLARSLTLAAATAPTAATPAAAGLAFALGLAIGLLWRVAICVSIGGLRRGGHFVFDITRLGAFSFGKRRHGAFRTTLVAPAGTAAAATAAAAAAATFAF